MRAAPTPDAAPEAIGPYRILRELARGGMGAVYEVVHDETGAHYALKTLLPDLIGGANAEELERFRREAEVLGKLNHPNVVRVHAADLDGTAPYLVQDLLQGGTLQERLKAGPLEVAEAIRIATKLGHALKHCHEHEVLHRDLKPSNVLFNERGEPLLVDFGLAHALEASQRLTATGTVMGTPGYMAPEQATGSLDVDARTDVYGLGAVLYHCLVGAPPFKGGSVVAILHAVTTVVPAPPSKTQGQVPAWLDRVVLRALEKKPSDRYQSVEELVSAIEAGSPATTPAHRRWGLPLIALAAVLGLIGLGLSAIGTSTPPPATPDVDPLPPTATKKGNPSQARYAREEWERIRPLTTPRARIDALRAWLERFDEPSLRQLVADRLERELSKPLHTLRHRKPQVAVASFQADGTLLSLGLGGELVSWSVETGGELNRHRVFDPKWQAGWIQLETLGSEYGVVYGGESVTLTWRQGESAQRESGCRLKCMAVSADGRRLAVCRRAGGEIVIFDVATRAQLRTLEHPGNRAYVVAFSPDGTRLAICTGSIESEPRTVSRLWILDAETGELLLEKPTLRLGRALHFLTDDRLVLGDNFGGIEIWNLETSSVVDRLTRPGDGVRTSAHKGSLRAFVVSPPSTLYSLSMGGKRDKNEVLAWDLKTRTQLSRSPGVRPLGALRTLSLSPDGRTLAICGEDGVEIWPVN